MFRCAQVEEAHGGREVADALEISAARAKRRDFIAAARNRISRHQKIMKHQRILP